MKFMTGLAVGVVAGMLLAPKSGRDMQDCLIRKIKKLQAHCVEWESKDDACATAKAYLLEQKEKIDHFDWHASKEVVRAKFNEFNARLAEIKMALCADAAK